MKFGELKRPEIERLDKTHKVVVLPLGSLEQHGRHLPLLTDSLIGGEIAQRVETALANDVLLLPMQWLGSSDHHLKFPGTISIPSNLYIDMIAHICECILAAGFKRILLFLSHGGNDVPCQEVIFRLGIKHRDKSPFWIASAGYWSLADEAMKIPEMATPRSTHACEYETSIMLALRGELVDLTQAQGKTLCMESKFYFPDFSRPSKVNISLPFESMTSTGAIGRPDLATPEKGHKLLDAIGAKVVEFVREFAYWERPTMG
ncbi:MAG: creatininase family protein [Planctomycetes bacterium]|nr:creatininase family protein [Planctomycetota bacterium]